MRRVIRLVGTASLLVLPIWFALNCGAAEPKPVLHGIVALNELGAEPIKKALLSLPGRSVSTVFLSEGERWENFELESIVPKEGRIRLRDHSDGSVIELRLPDSGQPVDPKAALQFRAAPLRPLVELYQDFCGRTVLLPDGYTMNLDYVSRAQSRREAAAELEHAFATNGFVMENRGELVTLMVRQRERSVLKEIPEPPPAGAEIGFPPGLTKFQSAAAVQVLEIYQAYTGRMVLRPPDFRPGNVTVKTQTPLTQDQTRWILSAALRLAGIVVCPEGDRFIFATPPEKTNSLPHFDRAAIAAKWQAKPGEARVIRIAGANATEFLGTFAGLVGREPVPVSPEIRIVQFYLYYSEALDPVETIFALEGLAWGNNLAFEKAEPNGVQLVPLNNRRL